MVSAVETAEQFLGLNDIEDVLPLCISWINTRWVVSAHVEHNERVVLGVFKVISETFVVKTLSLSIVVLVLFGFKTKDLSDGLVNGPCWGWDQIVDVLVWVPLAEEHESKSESTSSGE